MQVEQPAGHKLCRRSLVPAWLPLMRARKLPRPVLRPVSRQAQLLPPMQPSRWRCAPAQMHMMPCEQADNILCCYHVWHPPVQEKASPLLLCHSRIIWSNKLHIITSCGKCMQSLRPLFCFIRSKGVINCACQTEFSGARRLQWCCKGGCISICCRDTGTHIAPELELIVLQKVNLCGYCCRRWVPFLLMSAKTSSTSTGMHRDAMRESEQMGSCLLQCRIRQDPICSHLAFLTTAAWFQ